MLETILTYTPNTVVVQNNKVIKSNIPELIGTKLVTADSDTPKAIDLNIIPAKFNPATRRWSGKSNPTATPLTNLIETGKHPLVSIPEEYRKPGGLKKYLKYTLAETYFKNQEETITKTSYTLTDQSLGDKFPKVTYFPRFLPCMEVIKRKSVGALVKVLDKYGPEYSGLHTPYVSKEEKTFKIDESLTVENVDVPEVVKNARVLWRARNSWNLDPPSALEFEDNTEIHSKVLNHLSMIPGLTIRYLKKRTLAYYSDGGFSTSADAAPRDYHPAFLPNKYNSPLLYCGEAYVLFFTVNGKDYQQDNHIYFCTPEQYFKGMNDMRPDLVKDFEPWSDLIWISSDWCERNGKANYSQGIDLSTPHRRRLSLQQWLLGPFFQRCIEQGLGNPLEGVATIFSPRFNKMRWKEMAAAKAAQEAAMSEYNKIITELSSNLPTDPVEEKEETVVIGNKITIDTDKLSPSQKKMISEITNITFDETAPVISSVNAITGDDLEVIKTKVSADSGSPLPEEPAKEE